MKISYEPENVIFSPICHCPAEIIANVQALQSLSVDRSMEPEKQKAEVKHFLLQKQRALADLFKMLAQIGQSESFLVVLMLNVLCAVCRWAADASGMPVPDPQRLNTEGPSRNPVPPGWA